MFFDLNYYTVYLQVFDEYGVYTGVWQDITRHVKDLGNTSLQIDQSDYDLGVFQNSSLSIKVNNRSGVFNDVGFDGTFFEYKRADSLIKVTYRINQYGPMCGVITLPFICGEEVTVYKGLLTDDSFKSGAAKEEGTLKVLGLESIFDRVLVNYSSLSNGDTVEEILYTILNHTAITNILTVSAGNINVSLDQASDDVSDLEGKTVREAVDDLLFISNSILYINSDDEIIIAPRTASATSKKTFYGQASTAGLENIIDIDNDNNGLHRVFNYILWKETTVVKSDVTSIGLNGLRKKEISSDLLTNTTKRENVLADILSEFKDKKREMILTVNLNYDTLNLSLLDKINIDYPIIYYTDYTTSFPVLGLAILGDTGSPLPNSQSTFKIDITTDFKILQITYNYFNNTINLKIREA